MARVLRSGGTAITLETMTTGSETAAPPTERLAEYYRWLETERGFTGISIRTDYRFESLDEVDRLTRFFFGDELADRVRGARSTILRENTGISSGAHAQPPLGELPAGMTRLQGACDRHGEAANPSGRRHAAASIRPARGGLARR